jgi:hypothetical protein
VTLYSVNRITATVEDIILPKFKRENSKEPKFSVASFLAKKSFKSIK